jgi:hypothetical protein
LKALYDRYQSYERVARESAWSVSTIRKYIQLLTLPDKLQHRLGTVGGPAGVGTLARLASTFSGSEAIDVYDRISGFTKRIQEEILKRSDGDIDAIDHLVEEAHEDAFDVRRCGGSYGCEIARDIVQRRLGESDFQELVSQAATDLDITRPSDTWRRDAARAF